MKYICDMCGKSSNDDKICTNCGAKIFTDEEISALPVHDSWGWATFKFAMLDPVTRTTAKDYLMEKLRSLENFTIMRLVNSQLSRFGLDESEIKIIVREDFFLELWRDVSAKFEELSVTFESISSFETADEVNELLRKEWAVRNS